MLDKLKNLLGLIRIEMGSTELKDGTQLQIMGDLKKGVDVFVVTEDGNKSLPDGEYELSDGTKIIVADGKITDVIAPVPEEEKEDEVEEIQEEVETTESPPEPTEETKSDEPDIESRLSALETKYQEISDKLNNLSAENDNVKKENETLSTQLNDLKLALQEQPGAEPLKKKSSTIEVENSRVNALKEWRASKNK